MNTRALRRFAPLVCVFAVACHDATPLRPAAELRHGAAAAVPWTHIELDAWRGQEQRWRLPLRNPFPVPVRLDAVELEGCGKCLSAVWEGSGPDDGVTIDSGGETRLVLTYTGQPVGTRGLYRLRFRLQGVDQPPSDVAVDVCYSDPRPFSIPNVTLRTERDHVAALSVPWAAERSDPPASLRVTSGVDAVRSVLARRGDDRWTLTLVPCGPWKAYQHGVVVASWPGDEGEWIVPWQCVGISPVALHWGRRDGHAALRLSSSSRRTLPLRVAVMRGDQGGRETTLELPPRGVVDVPVETTGADRVVVRVTDSGVEQSIDVPDP